MGIEEKISEEMSLPLREVITHLAMEMEKEKKTEKTISTTGFETITRKGYKVSITLKELKYDD